MILSKPTSREHNRLASSRRKMATQAISLKLLIDKRSRRRVLFAEAGKDFVDFLFSLLAMPLGSVTKTVSAGKMVGSVGSIYRSVESLGDAYMKSKQSKSELLSPTASKEEDPIFLIEGSGGSPKPAVKIYTCANYTGCCGYFSDVSGAKCPSCGDPMDAEKCDVSQSVAVPAAAAAAGKRAGFVKGVVMYTVLDDLTVMPLSSMSSIRLLEKFNVKNVSSLEERIVTLGMKECRELLRVSLQSKTVLTDVFLG